MFSVPVPQQHVWAERKDHRPEKPQPASPRLFACGNSWRRYLCAVSKFSIRRSGENSSGMKSLFDWLDQRTGYRHITREALFENIPGGSRWRYVRGSTLTFTLAIQFITGIALWM